jgi:hypothetical protein
MTSVQECSVAAFPLHPLAVDVTVTSLEGSFQKVVIPAYWITPLSSFCA